MAFPLLQYFRSGCNWRRNMAVNNLILKVLPWRMCNGNMVLSLPWRMFNMVLKRPVFEVNLRWKMCNCSMVLSLPWRMCNMVLNRQVFEVNLPWRMCNMALNRLMPPSITLNRISDGYESARAFSHA